jgi:hypothetical protein
MLAVSHMQGAAVCSKLAGLRCFVGLGEAFAALLAL